MHERGEHLPLEWAVVAFFLGFGWAIAGCVLVWVLCLIIPAGKPRGRRPFMTPALREKLK
jgi:hypothetical protein